MLDPLFSGYSREDLQGIATMLIREQTDHQVTQTLLLQSLADMEAKGEAITVLKIQQLAIGFSRQVLDLRNTRNA